MSLLQSPLGPHHPAPSLSAPAPGSASNTEEEGPTIAHIPHQIRGFLSSYSQMTVTVRNLLLYLILYFFNYVDYNF